MSKRLKVYQKEEFIYNIVLERSYEKLLEELEPFHISEKKLCIVTDSTVGSIYASSLVNKLKKASRQVELFTMKAGEESKNLDTVKNLYEFLIINKFDRKDMLIALGGGVVGDLTGYAAATYLRGIDFIQLPTSLLSQVDSSIGGKTGVDFNSYKNMVGAFHQPKLVYINISTLTTLNEREYFSGMGEILKHGLIKDEKYYGWLLKHMSEIHERDLGVLEEMIYRSCIIKKHVVEKDPKEQGDRALLNFGHTIGHSIEKYMNFKLLHGECVALGSVAAAYISKSRGYLKEDEFLEIRDMFVGFQLPITISNVEVDPIIELTHSDKKMESGKLKFILLKSIGNGIIDKTVTDTELKEAVSYIVSEL